MAQLVERLVRNEEASGSNPLISTKTKTRLYGAFFVLWINVSRTAELSAIRTSEAERFSPTFSLSCRLSEALPLVKIRLAINHLIQANSLLIPQSIYIT